MLAKQLSVRSSARHSMPCSSGCGVEVFAYGGLLFEWDPEKSVANLIKHGVSFRDAATSFVDARAVIVMDLDHSDSEERWRHLGISTVGQLLLTGYTHRDSHIRVIFARPATRRERHEYFQGQRRRRQRDR